MAERDRIQQQLAELMELMEQADDQKRTAEAPYAGNQAALADAGAAGPRDGVMAGGRTVYRGVSRARFSGMLREAELAPDAPATDSAADLADFYNSRLTGRTIQDRGGISGGADAGTEQGRGAGEILLRLNLPEGTAGSESEETGEFAVTPGQSFRFDGAAAAGTTVVVYMTALAPAEGGGLREPAAGKPERSGEE